MSEYQPISKKRRGCLAAAAMGISAVLVTCVISGTVVLVYGMHVASEKADGLVCLAERTVRGLPDMARALPPALGDLVNDGRRPEYAEQIEVSARLSPAGPGERVRVMVEAANQGQEMVTMLSLRVVVMDDQGRVICESNEWAASPFAADGPWRGPLMAGGVRRFNASEWFAYRADVAELKAEVEITDVRIWNGGAAKTDPTEPAQPIVDRQL